MDWASFTGSGRAEAGGVVSMKRSVLLSALMLVSTIAWTLPPQGTDDQTISLGALARQLRAGRADAAKQDREGFHQRRYIFTATGMKD